MHEDVEQPAPEPADSTVDILYLVDRLEELVGIGKRVPFSGRVMVEEEEFLGLVDQLRVAVPNEIKQAQRIIKERENIVGEAQAEAAQILKAARDRAEYIVSQQGLLKEARQRGEELLRRVESEHKRSLGEIDVYALKQLEMVEATMRDGLELVRRALEDAVEHLEEAKNQVGR